MNAKKFQEVDLMARRVHVKTRGFRKVHLRAKTTNDLKKCLGPQILTGKVKDFVWSRKFNIV